MVRSFSIAKCIKNASFLAALATSTVTLTAHNVVADPVPNVKNWDAVLEQAKGQKVYWNAWGGSETINAYIEWVASRVKEDHGVELVHVKAGAADAVSIVLAEKLASKDDGGKVDLIWINGENFANMKKNDLLMTPGWAEDLPNWQFVDFENKPTIRTDFTIPVDGLEAPWGMAKLVFFHDSAVTKKEDMPNNVQELLAWAEKNPSRFAYPSPPDFIGTTFLKQVLIETIADPSVLAKPVVDADFAAQTKPLFDYLEALHPHIWRYAKAFPKDFPALQQLLADSELDMMFAFNPSIATNAINNDQLPDTVRPFTFSGGTLSNSHFTAVPYNANAKAGAVVVANFLMSPEAQAHKQDPRIWGDPTVLNMAALSAKDRAVFDALDLGIATPKPAELGPALDEPHPSWVAAIEAEWAKRFATAQ